jgi:O-antigen/teichoic acid export membrane protein
LSETSTQKSRAARLVHLGNVVVAQLNVLIVTAGSFVVTPAVLNALGESDYGGWLLINSFIGYMRMLDLGMSSGTVKFGAGAHERGDKADLTRVMNTSATMFAIVGTVTLLATMGMSVVLPRVYPNAIGSSTQTIVILGVAAALELAFRPFAAALRMRSLYLVYDGLEIVTYAIFKLALLIWFAHQGRLNYHTLALLTFGETAARLVFVIVAALWMNPASRRINPFRPERAMIRKLATMGAAMSIIQVADIVRFQLDAGVIGYFMPESPESISVFGVGTRLTSLSYFAVGVIGSVLMPRFSGLAETEDKEGIAKLLERSSLTTGLASVLVLSNLAVLGPHFLEIWLRKPWVHQSGQILLMMLPAYHIAILTHPSSNLVIGRGKLRGLTILTVAEAATNLVLSISFVHVLGIYGVALGTAIPLVVFRGIFYPAIVLKNEVGIGLVEYYRQNSRSLLVGIVYLLLIGGLAFVNLRTYPQFIIAGLCSTALFAIPLFLFVPEAREGLKARLARRRKRAAA